jgi:hypothetical protein
VASEHQPGHLLNDREALVMALILRDVRQRRAQAETAHEHGADAGTKQTEPTGGEAA